MLKNAISFAALICILTACNSKSLTLSKSEEILADFDVTNSQNRTQEAFSLYAESVRTKYAVESGKALAVWDAPLLAGRVDPQSYSDIYDVPEKGIFIVMSPGGLTRYGNKISNYMLDHDLGLVVAIACGSACAEDILPAARSLYFFDDPIISFHGNSQSVLYHLSKGKHADPCKVLTQRALVDDYRYSVQNKIERYERSGHNIEFWKEQEKRLKGFSLVKIEDGDGSCGMTSAYENADHWLPTSQQLKNLMGLKFKGTVCADNPKCYEKKLYLFFGPDVKFIIGDEFYETKLPTFASSGG